MMTLETKLPEISVACEANDVKRLELFGSYARAEERPDSDIDFLVEFADPMLAGVSDRYLALHTALQSIFGCRVDLIECSTIQNRVLRKRIEEDRRLVYAA